MKRKDMVEKMVDTLSDYEFTNYQNIYEIAEHLLKNMEELGVKPPCSCHDDIEHTKEKGYGPRCGISWHLSEWEEE